MQPIEASVIMGQVFASPDKRRRPGYSPASSELGRLGLHTRDRILIAAAHLFNKKGFHGVSIDAVAKAVGGSRALIYQYFGSKDEMLAELARNCLPSVRQHVSKLGTLGPNRQGLRHLHDWLLQWADLYDEFAVVFFQSTEFGLADPVCRTVNFAGCEYQDLFRARLAAAELREINAEQATAVVLRIMHAVNLYRFRGMFGLTSKEDTSSALAIAIQYFLFPETPGHALDGLPYLPSAQNIPLTPPLTFLEPRTPNLPDVTPVRWDILSGASLMFFERGYHEVGMDEIATASGVSRATVYRYFSTKVKILAELTNRAISELTGLAQELFAMSEQQLDSGELQSWLVRYLRFQQAYSGIVRAWHDGSLAPQLAEIVAQGLAPLQFAVNAIFGRAGLRPGLNPAAAAPIFMAVLGRVGEYALSEHPAEDVDAMAEFMMTVLQRAILQGPA